MDINKEIVVRARAVIINEGKLLVVKHRHGEGFAALPGGHLDWGEDIKECLSREMVEELGVIPEIGRLLYFNNFIEKEKIQSIEFFFEVLNSQDYLNFESLERSHSFELVETHWVEANDPIIILPKGFGEDFKTGKVFSDQVRYLRD